MIKNVYGKNSENRLLVCTPNELAQYRKAKCTCIIRLIDFLCVLMNTCHSNFEDAKFIPNDLFDEAFFACIINVCLDPQLVGFNLSDLEVYTNLPNKTKNFLTLFMKFLPSHLRQKLKETCHKLIDEKKQFQIIIEEIQAINKKVSTKTDVTSNDSMILNETNVFNTSLSNTNTDWLKLSQIVNGFEQLSEFELYEISFDLNRTIFDYIIQQSDNSYHYIQESLTCVDAKRKLFNLCLNLNFLSIKKLNASSSCFSQDFLVEILEKFLFTSNESNKKFFSFFTIYKNEICNWICKRTDFILGYVLNKISINFSNSINLLVHLLEYLASEKSIRKQ